MAAHEVIIYVDTEFGGLHTHLFPSVEDFTKLASEGSTAASAAIGMKVSSFEIVSGKWQFYKNVGFNGPEGPVLGPGLHPVLPSGIANDSISSAKAI